MYVFPGEERLKRKILCRLLLKKLKETLRKIKRRHPKSRRR